MQDTPFLQGGGGLGAVIGAHHWSGTLVGVPQGWPASIKALVGAVLQCQLPMYIEWGDGPIFEQPQAGSDCPKPDVSLSR